MAAIPIAAVALVGAIVGWPAVRVSTDPPTSVPRLGQQVPVAGVREHRYRMSAGIRLLLFWISKDNVGAARIVWRMGEGGAREYELLIGSDPRRAPRRVNRWGFIRERTDGRSTDVLGLMTEASEQSLEEARTKVGTPGTGPVFKLVRSRVRPGDSESETRSMRAAEPWSYRDLAAVVAAFEAGAGTPRVWRVPVAEGAKPGFLIALADLLHESVAAARLGGNRPKPLKGRQVSYVFRNTPYTLTLTSATFLPAARIDGRDYVRLLRHEFETLNLVAKSRERFALTCAIDGPFAEIPVQISYQPNFWFKAELVIDEREVF